MQLALTLNFLKKLAKNNNKEWFDKNRSVYEEAKGEVKLLVADVIKGISAFDPSIASLEPKDCMFRINRDVRFSKDKVPYKTNMGFMIAPGGKKSIKSCYYVHIEPGNCFLAGGIWMPEPENLKRIRQEIDYSGDSLKKILQSKNFKKYFSGFDEELKLVRMPKDYDESHPYAEWLKLKSFTVTMPLDESILSDKKVVDKICAPFKELNALNQFLNAALD
ncbi:DUF2461 domain-containing protein [Cytophaga aurantiaca]|uniref:DUF2461 domain-containing protein n=1 Tax=Cytophaga aurantiaca TaxID=29530 RepID=UPI00039E8CF7|nr:DUF2461 domain-containing protein [Cytophaga aurantiaca]